MAFSFHHDLQARWRNLFTLFLAFSWLGGIFFGVWISCFAGGPLLSLMRNAFVCDVSIFGLLLTATLPFLLSALAVLISGPEWLLPVSFVCGFLYGHVCLTAIRAFGLAGWLIRPILCFSISTAAPLTYLFWLRIIHQEQRFSKLEALSFLSFAVLIGSLDYSLISPFLADLLF